MDIRYGTHPEDFKTYTTQRLREEFLIQDLFRPGQARLVYSHVDRMISGGVCPTEPLSLELGPEIGTGFFLERRELGLINVGGPGAVKVDGREYPLNKNDGLYVGRGARELVFSSQAAGRPAHFFLASGPAHQDYPTVKIEPKDAEVGQVGSAGQASLRTIRKYIHPDGVKSCQLVMGVTVIAANSVWNSMPCHTHARRMEVYFYYDLPPEAVVFHFMGQPGETRHLVMRNEEAVISPSWSIHTGVGTTSYPFIWAMIGENQTFTDMDAVAMSDLR